MKQFKIILIAAMVLSIAVVGYAAVSTSTIFNNNTPGGYSNLVSDDVFGSDATPQYAVGTMKTLQDGRVYRYAHFGEDTTVGLLVAPDQSESSSLSDGGAWTVVASASSQTVTDGTVGSKYLEVTGTATAGQFAGGYLTITEGTGEGYMYRIKTNTATNNPTTSNFRIELYDPIQVACGVATTKIGIQGSFYANLESVDNAVDEPVAGVAVSAMDVSEAAYGWIQTKGPAIVLADPSGGAFTLGAQLSLSDGVDGAVQVQDAWTEAVLGVAIEPADTAGQYAMVYLKIE